MRTASCANRRRRSALHSFGLLCLATAQLSTLGCADSPKVAIKTVVQEIPVPTVKPLPPELVKDCEPKYLYPVGDITIEGLLDRLEAVEIALAICRNQMELVRAAQ